MTLRVRVLSQPKPQSTGLPPAYNIILEATWEDAPGKAAWVLLGTAGLLREANAFAQGQAKAWRAEVQLLEARPPAPEPQPEAT